MAVVIIPALFPAAAQAQAVATKAPVPYQQVLSTNPFGLLFKWYNVEYEHRIGEATTLGFSASHFDGEFANAALLARWYPERVALDGFYLGARAGAYGIKTHTYQYSTPPPRPDANNPTRPTIQSYPTYREQTTVVPGLGLEIGYNWLHGPKQNVSVGLGFGVTRMLRSADDYSMPYAIPNVRLVNIGIAF
jgi:hypothetical protein